MRDKMFGKGDHVIYGAKGICLIEDVAVMSLAPNMPERLYYVLKQEDEGDLMISVPADNQELISKMRHVLDKQQTDSLIASAKGSEMMWIDDKRERTERFKEILLNGMDKELLLMINCIYRQKQELGEKKRKLNVSDENAFKSAVKLVREEFAYALKIPQDRVDDYIRSALGIEVDQNI